MRCAPALRSVSDARIIIAAMVAAIKATVMRAGRSEK
jgi:hypothetical protein